MITPHNIWECPCYVCNLQRKEAIAKITRTSELPPNQFSYRKVDHPRWKYALNFDLSFELKYWQTRSITNGWASLIPTRLLLLRRDYYWNGLDCFPDIKWMLRAAAGHDALCQLAKQGVIPRLIADKEFKTMLLGDCPNSRWLPVIEVMYTAIRIYANIKGVT